VVVADPNPPEDGTWPMAAKNYASTRYSGLDEITTENVGRLRLAWSFETGNDRGHEAAPIVVNDTMYVVEPFPNRVHAFDLRAPGKPKWTYDPKPVSASQGVACCDVVNRGVAYDGGRIFFNTLDVQTIALDADTGRELWRTKLGDVAKGETMTMAPIVVKGKVLVGNSGGELGVRGWLTALDADTGAIAWRAYSTGPDADVLIGPDFHPHYAQDRGVDLGVKSWPPGKWEIGGGTVWGWISYDPALDLIFYGTGNPGPWNPEQRPGDNKWTAGIFARRPDDGQAIWFHQWSPHDHFDYDGVNENVLLDMRIGGELRSVIVHPERNGYVYVLDRRTGQVLSAHPFVHVTTSTGIDLASGRPREVVGKQPGFGKIVRDICPAAPGGKDWQPSAFSPRTGLLYIPHQHLCQDETGVEASYVAGTPYLGAEVRMRPGPGDGHRGLFTAWDPAKGEKVWQIDEQLPVWSGALATGGDLVFYGTLDGRFVAVDARTGKQLWSHRAASGIIGQPVTYRGPDGRQYVAVFSGVGGWVGVTVAGGADPRDASAGLGMTGATGDLRDRTGKGGELLVFALEGSP
jgi:PQQ-dependent dehydrogenase (methanol/ethanol family)